MTGSAALAALVSLAEGAVAAVVVGGPVAALVAPMVSGAEGDSPAVTGLQATAFLAPALPFQIILSKAKDLAGVGPLAPDETGNPIIKTAWDAVGLLWLTLSIIALLEYLNGFGAPDDGHEFRAGSEKSATEILSVLQNATPGLAWSGAGTSKYDDLNSDQQRCMQLCAAADQRIADAVKTQAEKVEQGRIELACIRIGVCGALALVLKLWFLCMGEMQVNPVIALLLAQEMRFKAGVFSALAAVGAMVAIGFLIAAGKETETAIDNAVQDGYRSVVDDWRDRQPAGFAVATAEAAPAAVAMPTPPDAADAPEFAGIVAAAPAAVGEPQAAGIVSDAPVHAPLGDRADAVWLPTGARPLAAALHASPPSTPRSPRMSPVNRGAGSATHVATRAEQLAGQFREADASPTSAQCDATFAKAPIGDDVGHPAPPEAYPPTVT